MKLYEYVAIYHPLPTKDQADRGEKPRSELIVDVKRVLSNSDKEAAMLAARDVPDAYADKLDRVEISVRPF